MADSAAEIWAKGEKTIGQYAGRSNAVSETLALLDASRDANQKPDRISIKSNDPSSLFWLVVSILSDQRTDDKVKTGGQGEDIRKLGGLAERFLSHAWDTRNKSEIWDGNDTWERDLAYWLALSGEYYVTAWGEKGVDGQWRPISDVLSPLETFHEPGSDGMGAAKVVRKYTLTAEQARDRAVALGASTDGIVNPYTRSRATIMDVWERREDSTSPTKFRAWNTVLLQTVSGGSRFLREPTKMRFTRIPIYCGSVGKHLAYGNEMPIGQGILELNKPIYEFLDYIVTALARIARQYQRAPWLATGIGMDVEPDDVNSPEENDDDAVLLKSSNVQANLRRIDPGRAPFEFSELINLTESWLQRGGLPYVLFGGAQGDLSGFAISQLITAASHKLLPYKGRRDFLRAAVGQTWLEEYRDGSYETVITGEEEIKPTDIPKRFVVVSDQPLALPSDRAERIGLARQAIPAGPLMSHLSMQEKLLDTIIEDPELDFQWRQDDQAEANPLTQMIRLAVRLEEKAEALRKMGLDRAAEYALHAAETIWLNLDKIIAPAKQGQEQSGMMSQNVLPNEMQARGMSPDMARAMMRSGQGRQTNAQRAGQ